MGARAWEEQRPLQSREPPGLRRCCVSPFPSQERAPKNVPQITLPPASPPAGSSRTGGQTDAAEDRQTQQHPQGHRRTAANLISRRHKEALGAASPLLRIRLKFRAMAGMFLSFQNTLFIMQKSAQQPSITGHDSCLAGLCTQLCARAAELPGRGHRDAACPGEGCGHRPQSRTDGGHSPTAGPGRLDPGSAPGLPREQTTPCPVPQFPHTHGRDGHGGHRACCQERLRRSSGKRLQEAESVGWQKTSCIPPQHQPAPVPRAG